MIHASTEGEGDRMLEALMADRTGRAEVAFSSAIWRMLVFAHRIALGEPWKSGTDPSAA
jgi:hypothetical protein